VRTRQPLRRALVPAAAFERLGEQLRAEVAAELNVLDVESLGTAADLVEHTLKANFRSLGKRFGAGTPAVARAVAGADAGAVAAALRDAGSARIEVGGELVDLGPDDVIVTEQAKQGWSVVNEHGETIALDLELTDELRRAGVAREAIRQVQDARKNAGLEVTDRIELWWDSTDDENVRALEDHAELIASEVLATSLTRGAPDRDGLHVVESPLATIWLTKV
jgi:isoleucyl-tRNA synthetase